MCKKGEKCRLPRESPTLSGGTFNSRFANSYIDQYEIIFKLRSLRTSSFKDATKLQTKASTGVHDLLNEGTVHCTTDRLLAQW